VGKVGVLGPDCWHGLSGVQFRGAAAGMGNKTCWLVHSVTHGTVVLVSLVFQREGSNVV
jgi:hypothetical protein